jgi:hypothetical protein
MAAKADIVIDQGTTFITSLNLTNDAGDVLNLSGFTAEGQVRRWYTSSTAIDFNIAIPEPTNGIITLSLTANQTLGMTYGRYVYDVITIDSQNNITRIVEGMLTVTPEVTRVV